MADTPEDNTAARTLQRTLTAAAHASAPFISVFLLVHLSAPALAPLGGSALASQVMILGREYYRTPRGHTLLVVLPLLVHTVSGAAKRALVPAPASSNPAPRRGRRLTSTFALAGYAAALALLPVHYAVHRVHPASRAPPVDALAPAELDFEYVKHALRRWPARSWALYAGLVVCVAWHAAAGAQIVWNTWLSGRWGAWRGGVARRAAAAAVVVVPVLSGLFVISREPPMAFMSYIPRFEAAFLKSWVYRIWSSPSY